METSLADDNDNSSSSDGPQHSPLRPSWFTAKRLLAVLCMINLLTYMERGSMASNGVNGSRRVTCPTTTGNHTTLTTCTHGTGIQGEFNLSNLEDGILNSAFVVGLLIGCPIFASLTQRFNPFRLVGLGLSVWTVAVAGSGLSFNFWFIAACRMIVGIGEASFVSLAAPFIDDNAPDKQRTAWLAMFYMCKPTGYAAGYVYGGLVGDHLKWRYAFWGLAALMFPFAVLGWVTTPLQLKGNETVDTSSTSNEEPNNKKTNRHCLRFIGDFKVLFSEKIFVIGVLGYAAYSFVLGAYAYWSPKAGYNIYKAKNTDIIFGGVTVVCGVLGTLAGGFLLDYMTTTISNAFKLLTCGVLIGGSFCFGAFYLKNFYGFLALFAIGEVLVFATQAPVNYVLLRCVKPSIRPLSMAMSTVVIHVLGDVPSSPLFGLLQDRINNWRTSCLILTSVFFLAAGVWFTGIFVQVEDGLDETEQSRAPAESAIVGALPVTEEAKMKEKEQRDV